MTGADHQDEPARPPDGGADLPGADLSGADLPGADLTGAVFAGAGLPGTVLPKDGLSWSWEFDLDALLAAVSDPTPWNRDSSAPPSQPAGSIPSRGFADPASTAGPAAGADPADPDADLAEYLEAVEAGRSRVVPLTTVAGRVAESVPAGVALAGWLAAGPVTELEDGALAGVAASYRRLASWAQAGELSAVAELASRSAAADDRIGVDGQGRPGRLPVEACAEVSLALVMSQASASWWTDLGVTLRWRLAATGAALRAGTIDLGRARAIAEATALLDEKTARAVEARMLAGAGARTMAGLRAGLRRAVIAADPHGAERRREAAERQAKVVLYPDVEGTASLAGYSLPGIGAAAALARITALAQALKASGAGGGIDRLRAHVYLGLLLGTLPHIPPPADAPPDHEPPDDDNPPHDTPPDHTPPDPGPPADEPPGDGPPGGGAPGDGSSGDGALGVAVPGGGAARGRAPAGCPGRDQDQGGHRRSRDGNRDSQRTGRDGARSDQAPQPTARGDQRDNPDQHSDPGQRNPPGQRRDQGDNRDHQGASSGSGHRCGEPWADEEDGAGGLPPAWPDVPAFLQPGPAAMDHVAPATGGLLDLRLPWATLTGHAPEPGYLARLGPITATQASYLAHLATRDSAARWRIIITDPHGRAIAVTRLPATPSRHPPPQPGLVGQITVIISQHNLTEPHPATMPPTHARILTAARAAIQAIADPPRPCAHADATSAYRPTRALWEHVTARDLTCRFPTCRQPATRCDLDHTTPYDQGGITCCCNLGAVCRMHHQIKGSRRWHLDQPAPGTFTWTTPTGRTYTTHPDTYTA